MDSKHQVSFDDNSWNILVNGTARTGKTYLATRLIEKLVKFQIPITLIECTHNPGRTKNEYEAICLESGGGYQDIRYDHDLDKSVSIFGIGMQETSQQLRNISSDNIIASLQKRFELFDKSFLLVDELSAARPDLQDFFNKVLKYGDKNGINSVHITTQAIEDINVDQYHRVVSLKRSQHGFSNVEL